MSLRHQTVQCSHAAIVVARDGLIDEDERHPALVILTVPGEPELKSMLAAARHSGIECREFVEEDLNGEVTAFATEPVTGNSRQFFRGLPLLSSQKRVESAA